MVELHSFCTLCRSQCGTINVVENGRLTAVRPDPSHPTGQAACLKGKAGPEIVAANNRILYPMRRTRPKTDPDPGWERISWDEALTICAERLGAIRRQHGPEGVAFAVTTKSGTGIADSIEWVDRFVRVSGSPNVAGAVDVCNWHKDVAHRFTFGVGMPVADYENAGLILLWGHNPTSTWLAQADAVARGRAKGARMIVVDPRATPLAQSADVWLRVRPGTDAALAMGLSRILIREGGLDIDFVRHWTNAPLLVREDNGRFLRECDVSPTGAERFIAWNIRTQKPHFYDTTRPLDPDTGASMALFGRYEITADDGTTFSCRPAFNLFQEACSRWTPDTVERVTGVPEKKLRAAADLLKQHKRIAYHAWNGVGQSTNATQSERAIATLYALRGCFDDIGCNRILAKQPANKVDAMSLIGKDQLAKALGGAERPIGPPAEGRVKPVDLYRAFVTGEPYPIRGLIGFGTNHLLTQGDTEAIRRGLQATEFHVHCDLVETPTARYADIVLPVSTPWERESLRIGFEISEEAENLIQLRPASIAPRGESRSDLEIVFALATRLGFGEQFFNGDVEAGWNYMLSPLGITTDELRAKGGRIVRPLKHEVRKYMKVSEAGGVAGFATQTRRVELYSELLLRNGQSPLPVQPDETVDRARFPLTLTGMKNGYFCHSQHHGIASLRRRTSGPTVTLHPKAARARKIAEGQWVEIQSPHGNAHFIAQTDAGLAEDVIVAEFGWWEDCEPLGKPSYPIEGPKTTNFNALVSADARDPISGSVAHKMVACQVSPVGQAPWRGFRAFRVTELERESDTALRIALTPTDGLSLPDYEPGQYLRIRATTRAGDEAIARAYSLTGPAFQRGRTAYEICVGLSASGQTGPQPSLSSFVHRELKLGDILEAEAPSGVFTIPRSSSVPIVLIANGIGITPFVGYLASLGVGRTMPETTLLYGVRNRTQHAFAGLLRSFSKTLPRLSVKTFYSQPRAADVLGRDYDFPGRVDMAKAAPMLVSAETRFYLCGSSEMVESLKRNLIEGGVPKFNIFTEAFVSPVMVPHDSEHSFKVLFKRSGIGFDWKPRHGTLLECAERLGIRAPAGCRAGQCESCAAHIISGQTRQQLGAVPEESDVVLTCQGIPVSDLVLDL